jgi:hypothetical protein
MALGVRYEIFKWLGVVIVMLPNLFLLFECLSEAAKTKKSLKGSRLVWHMVIWSIWNGRNNCIFNNIVKDPLEVVEEVKVLSCKWSGERLKISPSLFYKWCWDSGLCFSR